MRYFDGFCCSRINAVLVICEIISNLIRNRKFRLIIRFDNCINDCISDDGRYSCQIYFHSSPYLVEKIAFELPGRWKIKEKVTSPQITEKAFIKPISKPARKK